jgi:hypothetical protein
MTRHFVHAVYSSQHAGADRAANVAENVASLFHGSQGRKSSLSAVVAEISRSLKAGAPNQVASY